MRADHNPETKEFIITVWKDMSLPSHMQEEIMAYKLERNRERVLTYYRSRDIWLENIRVVSIENNQDGCTYVFNGDVRQPVHSLVIAKIQEEVGYE